MRRFTYNDMEFSVEETQGQGQGQRQGRWTITYKDAEGRSGVVGSGLFAGVPDSEIEACARRLVRAIFPVGIRCVGPDVAHPITIGDLKIVPPDVAHPNFIYWDKDSSSFPKSH